MLHFAPEPIDVTRVTRCACPDVTIEHPEIEDDGLVTVHVFPALADAAA